MLTRAESVYASHPHKKAMVNGIKTGVPFFTEAILFQYIGPVVATPLAVKTTSYLSKKGKINFKEKSKEN
jgi:hypothetical protein